MFVPKKQYRVCLIFTLFVSLLTASVTEAAEKNKDAKRNAQIIQQMRQQQAALQAELEAEKQALADKLEDASRNAAVAGTSLKNAKADLEKSKATLAKKNAEIDQAKSELEELRQQYENAVASLEFNDQQRRTIVENITQATVLLNKCTEKNQLLYSHGKSLIKIYENPSLYESVMRKERFFQLKRVELENILQDKLDEIDDSKMEAY
jgi:chromosome segregation ATPase